MSLETSGFGILGVGVSMPEEVRTNAWWPASFLEGLAAKTERDVTAPPISRAKTPEQRIQLEEMMEHARDPFRGARERRVASPTSKGSTYEIAAAKSALDRAGVDGAEIDLIITNSRPNDEYGPCNATIVQDAIGARNAIAFEIESGCASSMNAIQVADAMLRAGQSKRVLVACSSLFSRFCDWDDPASVCFGDGAGAMVLGPVGKGFGFAGHAGRAKGDLHRGFCVSTVDGSPWLDSDAPLRLHSKSLKLGHSVVMGSAGIAKDAVEAVLAKAGLTQSDITHVYCHQPSAWFNRACLRVAGLQHATTIDTFQSFGSVGAVNIPLNLHHAEAAGQLKRGDVVLLFSFGAGLVWASSVLKWA